jgi:hypothetical protein
MLVSQFTLPVDVVLLVESQESTEKKRANTVTIVVILVR